jgi:hypothetical protein
MAARDKTSLQGREPAPGKPGADTHKKKELFLPPRAAEWSELCQTVCFKE